MKGYDVELQEIGYGDKPLRNNRRFSSEDSVNSTTTTYPFTGLKPWRTYMFTIVAVYSHSQRSKDAKMEAETMEYGNADFYEYTFFYKSVFWSSTETF